MNLAIIGFKSEQKTQLLNCLYSAVNNLNVFTFDTVQEASDSLTRRRTVEYHRIWIFQNVLDVSSDLDIFNFTSLIMDSFPSTEIVTFSRANDIAQWFAALYPASTSIHYVSTEPLAAAILVNFAAKSLADLRKLYASNTCEYAVETEESSMQIDMSNTEEAQVDTESLPGFEAPKAKKKGVFGGLFRKKNKGPDLLNNAGPINQGSVQSAYLDNSADDSVFKEPDLSDLQYAVVDSNGTEAIVSNASEPIYEEVNSPEIDIEMGENVNSGFAEASEFEPVGYEEGLDSMYEDSSLDSVNAINEFEADVPAESSVEVEPNTFEDEAESDAEWGNTVDEFMASFKSKGSEVPEAVESNIGEDDLVEAEAIEDDLVEANATEEDSEVSRDVTYKLRHDALTGCLNRTAFEEDKAKLQDYELVMFDVNNLKVVNDLQGHPAGDLLLCTVASVLGSFFDNLYRVGGDEFVAIVETVPYMSTAIAEEIDAAFALEEGNIHCEVACGWATSDEGSVEEVYKLADTRMYQDKKRKKATQGSEVSLEDAIKGIDISDSLNALTQELDNMSIPEVAECLEEPEQVEAPIPTMLDDVSFDLSSVELDLRSKAKEESQTLYLANRYGKQVILVTGSSNSGSTRFALNLTSCYKNALYVDLDVEAHGSIFALGLDYHLALNPSRRHGLRLLSEDASTPLREVIDFYDRGDFAILTSSFDDDVDLSKLINVVSVLLNQNVFETIIIDCPPAYLSYIDIYLKDMLTLVVTDGYEGKFYHLFQDLYSNLTEAQVSMLLRNAGFVENGNLGETFRDNLDDFLELFDLNVPFVNRMAYLGSTKHVKGVYQNLVEVN